MDLQKEIHQTNVEKGFWPVDVVRNRGEMVALMITELSEAVEAHRKNNHAKLDSFEYEKYEDWVQRTKGTTSEWEAYWCLAFAGGIKDTVEDEFADTVIRILDYCYGWKIPLSLMEMKFTIKENFGENIIVLIENILRAYRTDVPRMLQVQGSWSTALQNIISFCQQSNIDILQHVQWKLKYNKTREFKHGKNY